MPRPLAWAFVGDGPSDKTLIAPAEWALRRHAPELELLDPDFSPRHHDPDLPGVIDAMRQRYRPDLIFVHRDAEKASLAERRAEIPQTPDVVG